MKAAWYEKNGAARDVLVVGEIETPEPGRGEVRVRLATSGVNPSDVKSRRGRAPAFPRIVPHSDGAGIIDAVGDGVGKGRIGERVWIWNGQWKRPFGTAAEFITLPEVQAVPLPDDVDFAAGACLGIPALTALQAVRLSGDIVGKTLLVTGAGSSVGYFATQIARMHGARVIGTASGTRSGRARDAGVDTVIDYATGNVAAAVKAATGGQGVNGIIDMDLSTSVKLIGENVVRPHGTIVCYGSNAAGDIALPFPAMLWNSYALKFMLVYELLPDDRRACVAELTAMLEQGTLRHSVGARFPLDEIAAAHEAVEGGKVVGNVVVEVGV